MLAKSARLSDDEAACLGTLLDDDDAEMRLLPPDERNRLVRTTIAAVLRLAARRVRLLLLVDDVQYLDIETLGLMESSPARSWCPASGSSWPAVPRRNPNCRSCPGRWFGSRLWDPRIRAASPRPSSTMEHRRRASPNRSRPAPAACRWRSRSSRRSSQPAPPGPRPAAREAVRSLQRLPARLESLLLHRIDSLDKEALRALPEMLRDGPFFVPRPPAPARADDRRQPRTGDRNAGREADPGDRFFRPYQILRTSSCRRPATAPSRAVSGAIFTPLSMRR